MKTLGLFLLALLASTSLASAQPVPVTQCITTAIAGGTSDAITIPQLPCVPTTTTLYLTITASNTTTTPTIKVLGQNNIGPQVIVDNIGAALVAGQLKTNGRYILTNNGSNWFVLNAFVSSPAPSLSQANNCPNIIGFGGAGDNTTDNSGPLLAAIGAQGPNNICVSFPAGKFKFSSTAAISLPSAYSALSIIGAGPGATEFIAPVGSGFLNLTLNGQFNTFNISNFSLETPSPCTGCKAISVKQPVSTGATTAPGYTPTSYFTNLQFYGTDRNINQGGATNGVNYWDTGIYVDGVSNINFEGIFSQGLANNNTAAQNGIWLDSTTSNIPVVFNFHSIAINSTNMGIKANVVAQGITVSQSNFTNDMWGVNIPGASGAGGQLTIADSAFACNTAVAVNSIWGAIQIANNLMFMGEVGSAPFVGVDLGVNAGFSTITGNVFAGTAGAGTPNAIGLSLGTTNFKSGIVTGNTFSSLETGIVLDPGTSGWIINPNHYDNTFFTIGDNTSGFDNVINTSVIGGKPTIGTGPSDCGTGPLLQGESTDQNGLVVVGASPGTACTLTFSAPWINVPICSANNYTSLSRGVTVLFATRTAIQLAASTTLLQNDEIAYRCDGHQ